jgi:FHA domain
MATCPSGHESASDDFCDVCGMLIGAPAAFPQTGPTPGAAAGATGPSPAAGPSGAGAPDGTSATAGLPSGVACPRCTTPRTGQFCEACGYDFTTATPTPPVTPTPAQPVTSPDVPSAPPAPSASAAFPASAGQPAPAVPTASPAAFTWTAVVTADRDYYDSVQAAGGPDAATITFPAYCPQRRFRLSGTEVRVGRRSVSRGIDPEIDLTGPPADPGVSRMHAVFVASPDGTWSIVDPGSENGTLLNGAEIPQGQPIPLHDGDRIHLGAWTALTITTS